MAASSKKEVTTETDFADYREELKSQFPDLDCEVEFQKFTLYWTGSTRRLKNPKLAWLNWLTKAREIKSRSELLNTNKKEGGANARSGNDNPRWNPGGHSSANQRLESDEELTAANARFRQQHGR